MDAADALARIYEVYSGPEELVNPRYGYSPTGDNFRIITNNNTDGESIPVGAVVLRASSGHTTFSVAGQGTPVFLNDIIKTGPETILAMELLKGGRIGVKKSTTVQMINDGEVATLDHNGWRKVALKSGGVWAKFNSPSKPLTIQTRGGVMGIKG